MSAQFNLSYGGSPLVLPLGSNAQQTNLAADFVPTMFSKQALFTAMGSAAQPIMSLKLYSVEANETGIDTGVCVYTKKQGYHMRFSFPCVTVLQCAGRGIMHFGTRLVGERRGELKPVSTDLHCISILMNAPTN